MDKKPTKHYSDIQEKMIADYLGWVQVSGSGAAPCTPGDVKSDGWLGECKTHTEYPKPIYFDASVWDKICKEAMSKFKKPVLFADNGKQQTKHTWCVCCESHIDHTGLITYKYPMSIRKNISFDEQKLVSIQKEVESRYVGEFYQAVVFTAKWGNSDVAILPLSLFKERYQE